jgi:NADH dehydrogenase
MTQQEIHAVTGAFGYSGKYIARHLLGRGHRVITLTNSLNRVNPFGDSVQAYPFNFDAPDALTGTLRGVSVLYNTYWVRFNHQTFTHEMAVQNTLKLFAAAQAAGVQKIVHISITNPSDDSPLEYFRGKARLEQALATTGLSYAILRPTVLFGKEDILINNIAWALRRLPVFGVFGDGHYHLQPIYVDDLARLAVEQGACGENVVIDAIGPETFTYRELVQTIGRIIGKKRPIIAVPPVFGYAVGKLIGRLVGDVMITREEIEGLMEDLLFVDSPPAGTVRLTDWAQQHAATLGEHYASELARRH